MEDCARAAGCAPEDVRKAASSLGALTLRPARGEAGADQARLATRDQLARATAALLEADPERSAESVAAELDVPSMLALEAWRAARGRAA